MEEHILKINSIEKVTRDVLKIRFEKPDDFSFSPGQAADVAINQPDWKDAIRPFTFTSLPADNFLEFHIKTYPEKKGVTNHLLSLKAGDELILGEVFGTINYRGEGTFIAGGAGITPFLAILRNLWAEDKLGSNKLLYANKTAADIVEKEEFESMLGNNFVNILSDEKADSYAHGFITEEFLKANISDFNKYIYLCGPDPMMDALDKQLKNLNVDESLIVKEGF